VNAMSPQRRVFGLGSSARDPPLSCRALRIFPLGGAILAVPAIGATVTSALDVLVYRQSWILPGYRGTRGWWPRWIYQQSIAAADRGHHLRRGELHRGHHVRLGAACAWLGSVVCASC
jgi:hypothetical protein